MFYGHSYVDIILPGHFPGNRDVEFVIRVNKSFDQKITLAVKQEGLFCYTGDYFKLTKSLFKI